MTNSESHSYWRDIRMYLTRYSPRYIRSLIYMLQASEYHMTDYLAWVQRTRDFSRVEHRKRLRATPKAILLLFSALLLVALALFVFFAGVTATDVAPHVIALILLVGFPLALPYLLLLPLVIIQAVQMPVEMLLVSRAKKALKKHPGFKIAIAGSYGKTSMREILRTVLKEGKKVAAPGGSENTPIGIARFVKRLKGDEEVLIFEFGEYYPGDVWKLCKMVEPQLGVITGINEAHLSKFKTVEAARDTILELADYLTGKNATFWSKELKTGPVYVNGESKHMELAPRGAVVFSRRSVEEPEHEVWKVAGAETSLDGTSFKLEHGNEHIDVQSKLLGLQYVGPLAAAAHIAQHLGLSKKHIEEGLSKTKPFAHRLERRDDAGGVITLDDSYNGNPDGVHAVIEFLKGIEGRRRWYVTPGLVEMGNKSEQIHKNIGKQIADAGIEKVVLIKNSVTPWIEEGYKEYFKGSPSEASAKEGEIVWFDDAIKCYESLPYLTIARDVVLLQNDWPDQYA